MKTFLNILRIICAFILSIILVLVLICAPILYSVSAFIQNDTIEGVIKNIDIVEILETDENFTNELQQSGLSSDLLRKFFNTNAVDEIIEIYVGDVFSVLDNQTNINFTEDSLVMIAKDNMNELIPIVRELISTQDESIQISDEQAEELVIQFFKELRLSIPNIEELGIVGNDVTQETKEAIEVIKILHSGKILLPFVIVALVLTLLVFICRYNKFEGFIWLAIDYIFPCGITFMVANSLKVGNDLVVDEIPKELLNVMVSALTVFAQKLNICALVLGVCAIIFIGIYIIYFNHQRKLKETEITL